MRKRKTGLLLIVLGILCIGISLLLFHNNQETEGKNKTEPKLVAEDSGEESTKDADEQEAGKTTTEEKQDSYEYLYYFYDENRNKETDDFLASNSIVHVAPHWWWQEPVDPH